MSGCRFSFYFWEHTHRLPGPPLPHPPVLNGQVETGPSGLPCLNCGNSTECGNGSKQHPWIVTGSLSQRDSSELSSRFFIESPLRPVSIPIFCHILLFRPHLHLCLVPSSHSLLHRYHIAVAICTKSSPEKNAQASSKQSYY